jgi:ABC-type siderophore export system fused ATPase/permease subunit
MLINSALGGKSFVSDKYNYLVFIFFICVSFAANRIFQHYMVGLTNSIMFDQEIAIVQKVRNASFESFTKMGSEKIYAALSDARMMSRIPQMLVALLNAAVTVLCSLFYLFWVAPLGGLTICLLMGTLLVVYMIRDINIRKDLNEVRDLQDQYYEYVRELMDGFRQIRISFLRNNNLFNKYIAVNRQRAKRLSVVTSRKYVTNELMGTYSWYVVLGVAIFILPLVFKITVVQTTVFVATLLFMIGPISQIVMVFPLYNAFRIAIERISKIDAQLDMDAVPIKEIYNPVAEFSSVRFQDIVYRYSIDGKSTFKLDDLNLKISKEEIVFVTGGNGSGKTTFIHILTGLCKPESGKIFINEEEVSWEEFSTYSNNMAVIFTNQLLFNENYDEHDLSENNPELEDHKSLINVEGFLRFLKEKEWLDVHLSKGQQKRLALLLSLMENKPIIVLDEWAAEQDPHNRRLFYTHWLPAIREMGKTIVAISHDDDFYHVADRVIKFDFGKITADTVEVHTQPDKV